MPEPQESISCFVRDHPRAVGAVYQVVLRAVTYQCAVAISGYQPCSPAPAFDDSAGSSGGPSTIKATNAATERICCRWGPREDDIDGGRLAALVPDFIRCPSTLIFILACILFLTGNIKLHYLNRYSISQRPMYIYIFITTMLEIDWKRILVSLQSFLPIKIWTASTLYLMFDPFFRWAMLGGSRMGMLIEQKMKAREERQRKRREAFCNIEAGKQGEERVVRGLEVTS